MPSTLNLGYFVSKVETHIHAQKNISKYCLFNTIFHVDYYYATVRDVLAKSGF
jgi:hypothetical protein